MQRQERPILAVKLDPCLLDLTAGDFMRLWREGNDIDR
jgi:hypothetical protein